VKRLHWLIDGGPTRFLVVVALFITACAIIIGSVLTYRFVDLRSRVTANAPTSSAEAAPESGTDAHDHADRPDPLSPARWGVSRWLGGDLSGMTPEAVASAPVAPVGAVVGDGGEVLVNGDSYAAVSVPLSINSTPASATVELSWNAEAWQVISIVVS